MAICIVCGDSAGWFKSVHSACLAQAEAGAAAARDAWKAVLASTIQSPATANYSSALAAAPPGMSSQERAQAVREVFSEQLNLFIAQGQNPTLASLEPYATYLIQMAVDGSKLPNRSHPRFVMLAVLADLNAGRVPQRVDDPGLGFAYERGEKIVWVQGQVVYMEDKVRHQSSGIYTGLSLRVVPGLWVRTGVAPQTAVIEGLVAAAEGNLVITDRAFWYQGPHGVMRIWFEDIIELHRLDDGIGFCQRGGRNQVLLTGKDEGWFAHSLVTQLAALRRQ